MDKPEQIGLASLRESIFGVQSMDGTKSIAATSASNTDPDRVVVEVLTAVAVNAEFTADMVGTFLKTSNIRDELKQLGLPFSFPREFLLGLGGVLRLSAWERSGLRDQLELHLPPSQIALETLFSTLRPQGEDSLAKADTSRLEFEVFKIAMERMAWASLQELRADVALAQPDDDVMLQSLADFLWICRDAGRTEE